MNNRQTEAPSQSQRPMRHAVIAKASEPTGDARGARGAEGERRVFRMAAWEQWLGSIPEKHRLGPPVV